MLSRCLGPISRWKEVLAPLSNQSYNAVHLVPIQQYGQSQSHYSIADQSEIADCFYPEANLPSDEKMQILSDTMNSIRTDLGMFGIIDIVLNHTANNSAWIQKHPEACYSTDNTPRLWPAWLLDKELLDISEEFSKGDVSWCPAAPYIKTEQAVDQVMVHITQRAMALNLHEFFLCNFDKTQFMEQIKHILTSDVTA